MGIKLIKKANEAVYKAIKNPRQATFIIDCGSPEKSRALNDAFAALAEKVLGNDDPDAKDAIGRNIIQFWDVGPYFTACVDPCDKAARWCEEWLRNSGDAAPGIQGNSAGLESKSCEALSPKMQQRLKLKTWQEASRKMKGFDVAGYSFLDLWDDGKCYPICVPAEGKETAEAAKKTAEKMFADFDDYVDVGSDFIPEGGPGGEDLWFPTYALKKTFANLSTEDGLTVLGELSDVLHKVHTRYERTSNEEISPKVRDRIKSKELAAYIEALPFFGKTYGASLDALKADGISYSHGNGSKAEEEAAAKKILSDFEDYLTWSIAKEIEDGEDVHYISVKFKPELWELPIDEFKQVFGALDDAFYEEI